MKTRYAVFHLNSERGFRGGERQLLYLAGYLRAQGHDNIIVCRKGHGLDRMARSLGYETLHLPFLGEWDPISANRLRRAASGSKLQAVLHAHTAHTAALASLSCRLGGPPWVAHRRVDFYLSGRIRGRLKYGSASVIVPVSQAVTDILRQQGLSSNQIKVVPDCIPLGVDEARMAGLSSPVIAPTLPEARQAKERLGRQWGVSPDVPWIGNIAALVPHKDQATLLRAFKLVLSEMPEARLFVIGTGPLKSDLETLARGLKISEAVRLTDHQSNAMEWLGALDLFVLSSWGEGMGSVLLEALAYGRPVVATTAGGIPEIISHEKNGLLVPPRNPQSMAQAMLESLRHPELARQRIERGFKTLENFTLSRCGRQIEECYDLATASRLVLSK